MLKKNTTFIAGFLFLFLGFHLMKSQELVKNDDQRSSSREGRNVVYFSPEIYPNVSEIKDATYVAFFSAVSDRLVHSKNSRMVRVDMPVVYENADPHTIREICLNNNAAYAVIPQVKFFKVGLGQFVFSSQVVVSMKLYDANGTFVSESSYDTFKKNARIIGSAQNSIKIGTTGALKLMSKDFKKTK